MATTASRLAQFELQDAAGTQLFVTARRDEFVVVEHKGGYYARVQSHPFTLLRIVNFHAGAGAAAQPITTRDLDGYPRYAPQLLSLYQVDGPNLRFISEDVAKTRSFRAGMKQRPGVWDRACAECAGPRCIV